MQSKDMQSQNQLSDTIINSYYQRFYQGRKSNRSKTKSNQTSKTNHQNQISKTIHQHQSIQIPQKLNLVFQIHYQTITSPLKPNPSHNLSQTQNPSVNLNNQAISTQFNTKQSTFSPPKNSLILELNIPASAQKNIKSKRHLKPSSIKNSKPQNFDHFLSINPQMKNCKNKKTKSHVIKVHNYSKTIDFDYFNQKPTLSNEFQFKQISAQKEINFLTLQNFSSIQLHNDKKQKNMQKNREIVDIVKRKQLSQTLDLIISQKNSLKSPQKNHLIKDNNNQIKVETNKTHNSSKKGLFHLFKPTIQLRKRPSTGIPMKRHQLVYSAQQHDKEMEDSKGMFNLSYHTRYLYNSPNKLFQYQDLPKHNRTLSLKVQSPPKLSIKAREIQAFKSVDLQESQRIKDFFRNSFDRGSKELKNIVRLDYHRKNSLIHKKSSKNKAIIKEEEFLPWESTQKDDEIIEIIN